MPTTRLTVGYGLVVLNHRKMLADFKILGASITRWKTRTRVQTSAMSDVGFSLEFLDNAGSF